MTNNGNIKDNDIILRPLPWRWFFYHWGINSLGILIGIRIITIIKGSSFTSSFLGFFIGVTIVTFWFSRYTDNWKIIISDNEIKGGWKKGKRIIIPLVEIDRRRSFKQSAFKKLFGIDYIFSNTGQKIYVESITLGKDQVERLRAKLNL
jgi:hypothetical protein